MRKDPQAEAQLRAITETGTLPNQVEDLRSDVRFLTKTAIDQEKRIERLEYLVAQLSQQVAMCVVRLNKMDPEEWPEFDDDEEITDEDYLRPPWCEHDDYPVAPI